MKKTLLFILVACFVQIQFYSFGQEASNKQSNLNFFLDCWDCDFTFVRQELEFVSFVRDPKLADVHILASSQRTGSGGERFFLNFIGLNNFKGQDYEYEYMADQSETRDETRQGLLKVIKAGILQYYSKTDFFDRINIDLADTEEMTATEIVADRWNKWVFSEVEYQLVHDQLYLPKGNASLEDVLLQRRKMATEYELGFEFGFQFTFGSIYNNIVNERF